MAFSYKPYSETEIKSLNLIEKGKYRFKVVEVNEKDKYGHPLVDQFTIKLSITDKNGRERFLFDYFGNSEKMAFKFRHFCSAIGLIEKYEDGTFSPKDALGKVGECEVIIRFPQPKKDQPGEFWPESNSVKDYVKSDKDLIKAHQAKIDPNFINDDIPDLR